MKVCQDEDVFQIKGLVRDTVENSSKRPLKQDPKKVSFTGSETIEVHFESDPI